MGESDRSSKFVAFTRQFGGTHHEVKQQIKDTRLDLHHAALCHWPRCCAYENRGGSMRPIRVQLEISKALDLRGVSEIEAKDGVLWGLSIKNYFASTEKTGKYSSTRTTSNDYAQATNAEQREVSPINHRMAQKNRNVQDCSRSKPVRGGRPDHLASRSPLTSTHHDTPYRARYASTASRCVAKSPSPCSASVRMSASDAMLTTGMP